MRALWKDSRYAVRRLLKTPGYTVVALATLALGIGANTAIFSVVNQVLLNPAGVAHPERIVSLRVQYDKLALHNIGVSIPDFADVLHSTQQFDAAALIDPGDFNYTGSTVPERLAGASVTREVVLSYAAWKRLFGRDVAPRRFVVTVLGVFAGMALLTAVIGLYGVISYAVTQRTQELGVRVALGAQPGEILRLVLGQGMRLAGAGAAIGLLRPLLPIQYGGFSTIVLPPRAVTE